ncbi:hypothetical protein AWENTII_012572 [Aspergillus wentii]
MDHHAMHHSDMDMGHGGMDHGGHGGMDMGGQCNMNMLFTWSSKNLCIIFRQWRVDGPISLLASLVVIVLLTAGYEGIRELTRRYEAAHIRRLSAFTATTGGRDNRRIVERNGKVTIAALYAVQVFYSFFIMLLFMTYNGLVMLAVAVGAFVGYLAFGQNTSAVKSVACH